MAEYALSLERINKYLDLTAKALAKVSIIGEKGTDNYAKAEDIIVDCGKKQYLCHNRYDFIDFRDFFRTKFYCK